MRTNIVGGAPWEPIVGYSRAVNVGNNTVQPRLNPFERATTIMVAVALMAAWVPVRRVTRLDPQRALRYE